MSEDLSITGDFVIEESESVSMQNSQIRETGLKVQNYLFTSTQKFSFRPSLELSEIASCRPGAPARFGEPRCSDFPEYFEPIYCNYDDLDSLGAEWWVFTPKPPIHPLIKLRNHFKETYEMIDSGSESLSGLSEESTKQKKTIRRRSHLDSKRIGCRCNMSKCLRLHCRCFKDMEYCAKICKCVDCFNTLTHEQARQAVINKTRELNPQAFNTKIVNAIKNQDSKFNAEGCNCKTGCVRNYCDCYKSGVGCSPICKCLNCKNTRLAIEQEELEMITKPILRAKNKVVFNPLQFFGADPEEANSRGAAGEDEPRAPPVEEQTAARGHRYSFPIVIGSVESPVIPDVGLLKREVPPGDCLPDCPKPKRAKVDSVHF